MKSYEVVFSDVADADKDAIYLRLSQLVSLDYATRWHTGLQAEVRKLSYMPNRFEVAPENAGYGTVAVRRMLYGRGRSAYRVLYHVIEPDEEDGEGLVRILRVLYASQ